VEYLQAEPSAWGSPREGAQPQRPTAWIAPDLIQHCDPLCRCGEIAPKSPRKRAIWYRRINRFNSTWLFFLGRSRCIERTSDPCDRRRAGGGRYEIHPITVCFGRRPTADGHGARGSKYQMGKPASRSSARLPVGGTVRTRHAFGSSRLHRGIRMVRCHRTERCAWMDLCRQHRLPLPKCRCACAHVRRGDRVSDHYLHDRRLLGPVLQRPVLVWKRTTMARSTANVQASGSPSRQGCAGNREPVSGPTSAWIQATGWQSNSWRFRAFR